MMQKKEFIVPEINNSIDDYNQEKIYGFRVRSGIKSGAWRCSSCEGKTMGSNLFQPDCDYCEKI